MTRTANFVLGGEGWGRGYNLLDLTSLMQLNNFAATTAAAD